LTGLKTRYLNVCLYSGEFVLNRAQKEGFVSELSEGVKNAQAFALMSFSKLSVEQMTSFRLSLSKQKVRVKVVKNTLAKRVFTGTAYEPAVTHLQGPTLIAYSSEDPVAAAKAIMQWVNKENFDLKVKAGMALGKMVSGQQMVALSKLPGRNELYVSFLWALKSHPTRFLYALQDAPKRLGYGLAALKAKKETEGTPN
jgi:large subunit ribosomal protein L10